jgi:ribosomal protein S27E
MLQAIRNLFAPKSTKMTCDRCGNDQFYFGPEGGAACMVECSKCGKIFLNDTYRLLTTDTEDFHITNLNR